MYSAGIRVMWAPCRVLGTFPSRETAEQYRLFSAAEVRGRSPVYERLSAEVADDAELVALIGQLPPIKRQPNRFVGAARFLGAPLDDDFRSWTVAHWPDVRDAMLTRRTQTNEVGRCAVLLPVLARIPGPLALIEVGASAGLCLSLDRYRYVYDDRHVVGDGPVELRCRTNGRVPLPDRLPEVVWRAGIDLNPLDVSDDEAMRWLENLVWPGQDDRLTRLRGAVEVARCDPPRLIRGDLNEALPGLVAAAPRDATLVVFHSAVLPYVNPDDRDRFVASMGRLPVRWISNEASFRLPAMTEGLSIPAGRMVFLVGLDGEPLAVADPHGAQLDWI